MSDSVTLLMTLRWLQRREEEKVLSKEGELLTRQFSFCELTPVPHLSLSYMGSRPNLSKLRSSSLEVGSHSPLERGLIYKPEYNSPRPW